MTLERLVVACAALCTSAIACAPSSSAVTRVVRGQELPGRYISTEAYAAYARAAYLESHGDLTGAAVAYHRAADEDERSAEIWTRIADVYCRSRRAAPEPAFRTAERLDAHYEPLWRARARCESRRGRASTALRYALFALRLDPDQDETSLLIVQLYETLGRKWDAQRYLDAWVARSPRSPSALATLLDFATRHGDIVRRERAEAKLGAAQRGAKAAAATSRADDMQRVDRALEAGDLKRARSAAADARVSAGALAARAAALGALDAALEQARFTSAASPADADAWVAALAAAAARGDQARLLALVADVTARASELDPLSVRLLARVLCDRVSPAAATAWLAAYGNLPEPRDAVERALADELRARQR